MIHIELITSIKIDELKKMGFNGYQTKTIINVTQYINELNLVIDVSEKHLEEEYTKVWQLTDGSVDYFNDLIKQGYSIGVYDQDTLIGFSIMTYHAWNNSMWIENFRVSEKYMGQGIGKRLMHESLQIASKKGARILGLETQSTNVPAIKFYEKCGFRISGVDFYKYPQRPNDLQQIGILMAKEI